MEELKIYIVGMLLAILCSSLSAQEASKNYIQHEVMLDASGGSKNTTITYLDGIGRPCREVTNSLGTTGTYVSTMMHYDACGRLSSTYFPTPIGTSLTFPSESVFYSSSRAFYGDDSAYESKSYDVLQRETASFGGGDLWQKNGREVSMEYGVNTESVKRYLPSVTNGRLQERGEYAQGSLYVEMTKDEDGKLGTLKYDYNIRGWLTLIEDNMFSEKLYYADSDISTPCFNGNVSSQIWKNANDGIVRGYAYSYDEMNRLTSAVYGEGTTLKNNRNRYTESVSSYDKNSSILSLQRYGKGNKGSYGLIDDLRYNMDGNQVRSITDKASRLLYTGSFDFKQTSMGEYAYDGNGRLVSDPNKGISSISYDNLSYPRFISYKNGNGTSFCYSSKGEKLSVLHQTGLSTTISSTEDSHLVSNQSSIISQTDYVGNVIYEQGSPQKILFDGGYYSFQDKLCHYFTRDHLGSIRTMVNENGVLEQSLHYYPFGGIYGDACYNGDLQLLKYNGKELERMYGLDCYDYGERFYDAAKVCWDRLDKLCEEYYHLNPYAYCGGNPVNSIDLCGNSIYMLFYTAGNPDKDTDAMFKAAAETRKNDIISQSFYNAECDKIIVKGISDMSKIGEEVANIVRQYSAKYGKTKEFSIWSHSGTDGPIGTERTSQFGLEEVQMTLTGWGKIQFNWAENSSAYFYGCRSGVRENGASFSTKISSLQNFRNVDVYGQNSYSFPSRYTNCRKPSLGMLWGRFDYPTYMVGGNKNDGKKAFLQGVPVPSMRKSRNGIGRTKSYYQIGKKY